MRYYVDDKEVSECEFDSELRDAIYEEVSKNFDDYLDEIKALSGSFPIQRRIPDLSNKKER